MRIDEFGRAVVHVDRAAVGLLRAVSPDHQAVLCQYHQLQVGIGPHGRAHLLGQCEPRPDVRDPGSGLPEAVRHESLAVACARQRVDRVRMCVVHVRRRDEGVQQGLDRGARRAWVELTTGEVGDHLLVAHLLTLEQRHHVVEAQLDEVAGPHRRQIGARALHPHHRQPAAEMICPDALRRGVPPTEVRNCSIGAEQVRGEQQLPEQVVRNRPGIRPAVLGRRDPPRKRAHWPHPPVTAA